MTRRHCPHCGGRMRMETSPYRGEGDAPARAVDALEEWVVDHHDSYEPSTGQTNADAEGAS